MPCRDVARLASRAGVMSQTDTIVRQDRGGGREDGLPAIFASHALRR